MDLLELSPRRVLCLGAHSDDIEIGCGGTLLRLVEQGNLEVYWVVFSADSSRAAEAHSSAARFLEGVPYKLQVLEFRDGFFPAQWASIKEAFRKLAGGFSPDLLFTPARADRHQDHRVLSDLTWNTWRDHLILEYEIPKWDGDLATPNVYVRLEERHVRRKIEILLEAFPSQRGKHWFDRETFTALLRLRGLEAATRYAEGFYGRKLVF